MPRRPGAPPSKFSPGHSHVHFPEPVPWSAEREARGATTTPGPRCPFPACPVRYRAGSDRPCPDHAPPPAEPGRRTVGQAAATASELLSAAAAAAGSATAGVRLLLAAGWDDSRRIREVAGCSRALVSQVRNAMEARRELHVRRKGVHLLSCWCDDEDEDTPHGP